MKTLILLIAAGLLAATSMAADIGPAPVFQLRLVAETPSATSEPMVMVSKSGDRTFTNILNIEKAVLMDQTALQSAHAKADALGHPIIEIAFTKNGTEQFATVTKENIGKRLAIIIDGQVREAPFIRTEIPGGEAQISGSFGKKEAADLARKINALAKR